MLSALYTENKGSETVTMVSNLAWDWK